MTKRKLILLCGVPCAGKTWVCQQLMLKASGRFTWVPHDDHIGGDLIKALLDKDVGRTLITECPFGERQLREDLTNAGFDVRPVFIVEPPYVISQRCFARDNKPASKATITRATTIQNRAGEWQAPSGTSLEILDYLLK